MKMMTILVAAVAVAGCDNTTNGSRASIVSSPTPAIAAAQFFPQTLPIALVTTPCASGLVFSPGFDLVIVQTGPVNVFMDQVTLHLLDGTNVGGPSITFPRSQLNAMFGSMLVAGNRAFGFQPQFGCGLTRPVGIVADVVLIDAEGTRRSVSVNARFQ